MTAFGFDFDPQKANMDLKELVAQYRSSPITSTLNECGPLSPAARMKSTVRSCTAAERLEGVMRMKAAMVANKAKKEMTPNVNNGKNDPGAKSRPLRSNIVVDTSDDSSENSNHMFLDF
jgi:hypothetical protein